MSTQNSQPETAPATAHTPMPGYTYNRNRPDTHGRFEEGFIYHAYGHRVASMVFGIRPVREVEAEAAKIVATLNGQAALISERDRLRDALEIYAKPENWDDEITATEGGDEECKVYTPEKTTFHGDPESRGGWEIAAHALANTTPSESARLREINAELSKTMESLVSQPGLVRIYDHIAAQENCDTEDAHFCMSVEHARAALKKAKDAQGGKTE